MAQSADYIAVFDSGVGGISVLRRLRERMPNERYLYFGDSANAPYGTRPVEQVRQLTLSAVEKLVAQGIKTLVVGCNTATTVALDALRQAYPQLIVEGIEPAVQAAADRFLGGSIGVMATPVTLAGEKLLRAVENVTPGCQVSLIPAPGLAELVEAGKQNGPEGVELLERLLLPYVGKLDALVLGCTHYPFAAETISRILGSGTVLLDGSDETARRTFLRLEEQDLLYEGPGQVVIQNSLPGDRMLKLSQQLAGLE